MLVGKAFRHGFYWPTALKDDVELVRRCNACQFHAKQIHTPAQAPQMIPPSWPFAVWGVDILGPFPRAVGGYRFLYVAIDKFTKWPEVTPVVNITKKISSRIPQVHCVQIWHPKPHHRGQRDPIQKQTLPRVL